VELRSLLRAEYRRRRDRNARYSMRAFALDLREDHSTLLRLLRGRRRLTRSTVERLARRLGLGPHGIDRVLLREGEETVLALVGRPDFRPDARWLAVRSGLSLDDVCVVLHALLRTRRLTFLSSATWQLEEN
jgi:hypothetical protein